MVSSLNPTHTDNGSHHELMTMMTMTTMADVEHIQHSKIPYDWNEHLKDTIQQ